MKVKQVYVHKYGSIEAPGYQDLLLIEQACAKPIKDMLYLLYDEVVKKITGPISNMSLQIKMAEGSDITFSLIISDH